MKSAHLTELDSVVAFAIYDFLSISKNTIKCCRVSGAPEHNLQNTFYVSKIMHI